MLNHSVTKNQDEILELKKQIQHLIKDKNTFESQTKRLESFKQTQKLETLNREKATWKQNKIQTSIEMERLKASNIALVQDAGIEIERLKASNNALVQSKQDAIIEIERLKASNASLEQLLKSKQDAIVSLLGENTNLSTANQLITEIVETQKSLLQAKANEMELLRQNMEHLLANVQDTRRLNPAIVGSSHDDGNAQNDINYDTEPDYTEESGDDINYDTPSEDEEK